MIEELAALEAARAQRLAAALASDQPQVTSATLTEYRALIFVCEAFVCWPKAVI